MALNIVSQPFRRFLYGLSGPVEDRDYAGAGLRLMDDMWREIRERGLKHKGVNHWVYDAPDRLFVGVELVSVPDPVTALERKEVLLPRYAYRKHLGAYAKLGEVHADMHRELRDRGLQTCPPAVEIYGHWTADETKLETEVLICLASRSAAPSAGV